MIVVTRPSAVIIGNEVTIGVQTATNFDKECWSLRVPSRLLVPHPLHPDRTPNLLSDPRRFTACVIGGSAPVALRAFHPHHTDLFSRHAEKRGYAVPHAIRLHVI